MNQIELPEDLPITFTAKEISEMMAHLSRGEYGFVAPIIGVLNERMLKAHKDSLEPKK